MKTSVNHTFTGMLRPFRKKSKNIVTIYIGSRVLLLKASDIAYLQGQGNYTAVHTPQGQRYLVSKTMKTIQEILGESFLRIHKSYAVNTDYIVDIVQTDAVIMSCGTKIPIARRRMYIAAEMIPREYLSVG